MHAPMLLSVLPFRTTHSTSGLTCTLLSVGAHTLHPPPRTPLHTHHADLRYVFRDIDSRVSYREAAAVGEWVTSGRAFHVMRDHPSHSSYAMSGGMWGGTRKGIPEMNALVRQGNIGAHYVADMDFLNKRVWPIVKRDVLQHDAFSCTKWGGGRPFPTPRVGGEHVGGVVVDGKLRQGDVDILLGASQPSECATPGGDLTEAPAFGPAAASAPPTPSTMPFAWVRIEMGGAGSNSGCGASRCIFDDR